MVSEFRYIKSRFFCLAAASFFFFFLLSVFHLSLSAFFMSTTTTSPATSPETIAVSASVTLLNVNMTNVTKLTDSNLLMWSRQVHALLDGYDLTGYIDRSLIVPSPTIIVADAYTVNPAYTLWKRQDRLI